MCLTLLGSCNLSRVHVRVELPGLNGFKAIYTSLVILLMFLAFSWMSNAQSYSMDCSQDYNWSDGSGVPWIRDSFNGYDDNSSLRSGPIEVMGLSSICRKFQGPGEVKFRWMTDIPSKLGTLVFLVDGFERNEYTSNGWVDANYSFRSNKTYWLEWRFIKISNAKWMGHAWLDDIIFLHAGMPKSLENPENYTITYTKSHPVTNPPGACSSKQKYIYTLRNKAVTIAKSGIFNPEESIFPSIQQAIDNVTENGKVLVFKGYYEENILINKSINLIGFYNSTIKYLNKENATIRISSNNVSIVGCIIEGGREAINASIDSISNISDNRNINISNNIINTRFSGRGIVLIGISNWYIINNTINEKLNFRNKYCIFLNKIPEKFEEHIYNNRFFNSEVGVRAPLGSNAIMKKFSNIINPQCSVSNIGEEVIYEN